jgi:sensor histidine kinase YesM
MSHSFLEILKMRYEDNLVVTLDIEKNMLQHMLPPMAVQMLIENAIKHNEISSEKKLHIDIVARDEKLTVTNNLQTRIRPDEPNGMGLLNIQSRYGFLVDRKVEIHEEDGSFIVVLPLLKEISE